MSGENVVAKPEKSLLATSAYSLGADAVNLVGLNASNVIAGNECKVLNSLIPCEDHQGNVGDVNVCVATHVTKGLFDSRLGEFLVVVGSETGNNVLNSHQMNRFVRMQVTADCVGSSSR